MVDPEDEWMKVLIEQFNRVPDEDFEGYSPEEMGSLFDFLKDPLSPVKINVLSDKAYEAIPLLNQVCLLMSILDEQQTLALTKAGNLPPKWVKALYVLGPPEPTVEISPKNVIKEQDTIAVHLARVLLSGFHLSKERNNKLSLTQQGKRLLGNKPALVHGLLDVLANKFNWGYFDDFDNSDIGRMGLGFTLVLLAKYGNTQQTLEFYADKYFKAFPGLLGKHNIPDPYVSAEDRAKYCYCFRNFERYLSYLGLVDLITKPSSYGFKALVKKTPLFDQLISVVKPQGNDSRVLH